MVIAPPSFDFPNTLTGSGSSASSGESNYYIPGLDKVPAAPLEDLTDEGEKAKESLKGVQLEFNGLQQIASDTTEQINAMGAIASLAFDGISSGIDSAIDRMFFVNGKFLELKNIAATLGDVFRMCSRTLLKTLLRPPSRL